jgi:hypothetical protein
MRHAALCLLCLSAALFSGCRMLDPNSKWNPNRGDYRDEFDIQQEARGGEAMDHEDLDGADRWILSPKARAINRNLGID